MASPWYVSQLSSRHRDSPGLVPYRCGTAPTPSRRHIAGFHGGQQLIERVARPGRREDKATILQRHCHRCPGTQAQCAQQLARQRDGDGTAHGAEGCGTRVAGLTLLNRRDYSSRKSMTFNPTTAFRPTCPSHCPVDDSAGGLNTRSYADSEESLAWWNRRSLPSRCSRLPHSYRVRFRRKKSSLAELLALWFECFSARRSIPEPPPQLIA